MGSLGSGLVYCTVYLTILCEPIIFHLICMETLRQVRGCVLTQCAKAEQKGQGRQSIRNLGVL